MQQKNAVDAVLYRQEFCSGLGFYLLFVEFQNFMHGLFWALILKYFI